MAAALVPRELTSWSLSAVALGALEGGLLGVMVMHQFAGVASPGMVNLAATVVAAAPSFTNLSSFVFAALAVGRDKPALISQLMFIMAVSLASMAVSGINATGLAVFCCATIVARTAWTGILTIRAAVWRTNYHRDWRGRVTARIVQLSSLLVGAYSMLIGFLLDWRVWTFRPAFILGAACALAAALVYRKARVRRHRRLLTAEREEKTLQGRRLTVSVLVSVLRKNKEFRQYMTGMMIFGGGNLMLIPMLVILLSERMDLSQLHQVVITSSLPLVVLCFSIPYWARLLDRLHIFSYRAIQCWYFVASSALFTLALILGSSALLWPASIILGGAYAGGNLGWNLGHDDFSSDGTAAHYMAIHVTLTGLRGLVVPFVGVGFYQFLAASAPQFASYALLLPLALNTAGSISFVLMHVRRKRRLAGEAAPHA
jgi:MFS family permease